MDRVVAPVSLLPAVPAAPPPVAPVAPAAAPGLRFGDVLAALNPLHHVPLVGAVYRHVTGATLHPAAQVLGGLVFGGPLGLFAAALGATFTQATGQSPLAATLAALRVGPDAAPPAVAETPAPAIPAPALPEPPPAAAASVPARIAPPPPAPARDAGPAAAARRDLGFYRAHPVAASGVLRSAPDLLRASPGPSAAVAASRHDDFAVRMRQGLERYHATARTARPGLALDRAE
jgi:hypothetical protein